MIHMKCYGKYKIFQRSFHIHKHILKLSIKLNITDTCEVLFINIEICSRI